jgi:hypothetical protein
MLAPLCAMITPHESLSDIMKANLSASPIRLYFYAFAGAAVAFAGEKNRLERPLYIRSLCWMMASFPVAFGLAII